MKKRMLALVLTLAMLLSLFPGQVFATETTEEHAEHPYTEVQAQQSTQSSVTTQPHKGAQTSADAFVQSLDYDAAIEDLTYLTKEIGIRVTASENEYRAQDYGQGYLQVWAMR
jgi:peptidoglycan hydrolase CwlO-like protein